jgi:excisionase family DNA binding protein
MNEPFISFQEACAFLGFSESYMYKLSAAGMIPFYKPTGKTLFFLRSELEQWVKGGTHASPTRFEKSQQAAASQAVRKLIK